LQPVPGFKSDTRVIRMSRPPGLAWRLVDDRHVEITRPSEPGSDRARSTSSSTAARDPIVMGIGLPRSATLFRSCGTQQKTIRWRRRSAGIRHALGFGISQSGRRTGDFVHLGSTRILRRCQVLTASFGRRGIAGATCVNWQCAQAVASRASMRSYTRTTVNVLFTPPPPPPPPQFSYQTRPIQSAATAAHPAARPRCGGCPRC